MSKEISLYGHSHQEEEIIDVELTNESFRSFPAGRSLCIDEKVDFEEAESYFPSHANFKKEVKRNNPGIRPEELSFLKLVVFDIPEETNYIVSDGKILFIDGFKNIYWSNDTTCKNIYEISLFNAETNYPKEIGELRL